MNIRNIFRRDRLASFLPIRFVKIAVRDCVSFLQRGLMKAAVAASLQLCLFAARILLSSARPAHDQAGQSL
ncbi:MAG: hypothetical protein WBB01_17620 [Phormidesmis sp.]